MVEKKLDVRIDDYKSKLNNLADIRSFLIPVTILQISRKVF